MCMYITNSVVNHIQDKYKDHKIITLHLTGWRRVTFPFYHFLTHYFSLFAYSGPKLSTRHKISTRASPSIPDDRGYLNMHHLTIK